MKKLNQSSPNTIIHIMSDLSFYFFQYFQIIFASLISINIPVPKYCVQDHDGNVGDHGSHGQVAGPVDLHVVELLATRKSVIADRF